MYPFAVDQMEGAEAHRLAAEKNIRCYIEITEDVELLMNERDPEFDRFSYRSDTFIFAFNRERAGIRLVHAAENLHQRGICWRHFHRPG